MTKPCPMCGAEQRITGQSINPPGPERVEPCKVCGEREPEREAVRKVFFGAPEAVTYWRLGAQWYTFDSGSTWTQFPSLQQIAQAQTNMRGVAKMTVTKIDGTRREITVAVEP